MSTQTRRTVTRSTSRRPSTRISANGLLYPLDRVCARAAVAMPRVSVILPDQIPKPYRSLLVHDSDMTRTLERHVGDRAVLRLPVCLLEWGVLLPPDPPCSGIFGASDSPWEPFAYDSTHLHRNFARRILAGRIPLGRILREGRFAYTSTVKALLAVEPTPEIMGIFWMPESKVLYGRRSAMFRDETKIADIVEILPPLPRTRR